VHKAITALGSDPAIAAAISLPDPSLHLCVLGGVAFGYDLHVSISEHLSATLSQDVPVDDESIRLLRFLRVTDGVMQARARVTIVGFAVEAPIELPFGRLLPAAERDLALRDVPAVMPPFVVFEYTANVPARIASRGHAHPFTEAEREQLEGAINELHDTRVGRLLVAHALIYTGPVQEHYVRWIPRYSSGDVGRYLAPPAAVWTEEWPQPAIPFPIDDSYATSTRTTAPSERGSEREGLGRRPLMPSSSGRAHGYPLYRATSACRERQRSKPG